MNVGSSEILYDAIGFASDDIWAVGGNTVARWDGKSWSDASTGLEDYANLGAVWGATPDDLWAVGALKRFRKQAGGPWQKVGSTGDLFEPFDVTGSGVDDVLLPPDTHFNGTSFDNVLVPRKVWSAGPHDYWGIDAVQQTKLMQVTHHAQLVTEYNSESFGVALAPDPDTLYRSRLTGVGYTSVVEKRVSGQYQTEVTGLASSYWLSGNTASDIWVVDNTSCDTSHFDGAHWTKLVSGPGAHQATRVAVTPDGNAWIGCGKQLAHFESGAWKLKQTFTDEIYQVAASSSKVWAVTRSTSAVYHLFEVTNGVATPIVFPIEPALNIPQLAGVDASGRLWASSINGYASFYTDGAWHNFPYKVAAMAVRGREVWFTDYPHNMTYRFDGTTMQPYSTSCGPYASQPVIAAPGDVWFSNDSGMCHLRE